MGIEIWSFVVIMVLLVGSGASSVIRKKKTTEDYLVASRAVKPWLSALSAVATNNSGFMFIGMIAYTYKLGIESIWMMIMWILGDLTAWILVHPKVRRESGKRKVNTLSELIGATDKGQNRVIVAVAGIVTFLFLGVYAAAQLKAGSTALMAIFGWHMWVGVTIGAAIVVIYSYAGGIRADIWTDAAQSLVMIVAMTTIMVMGWIEIGGPSALFANLRAQEPQLMDLFPQTLELGMYGIPFYLLGLMAGGYGSSGQPHIMTRYMAIESDRAVRRAGVWYFVWYVPFFAASVGVGLYTRALMPELPDHPLAAGMSDPTELALPLVTTEVLPGIFTGIALAGLFAATVSTADSQIIVCSGALTHDINPRWRESYLMSKVGTFSVTGVALVIALFAPEGVFGLVMVAWSAMGASLGSVLVLRLFRLPVSTPVAVAMMITGLSVVVVWHVSGYNDDVFKMLPGLAAAFAVYGIGRAAEGWWGGGRSDTG